MLAVSMDQEDSEEQGDEEPYSFVKSEPEGLDKQDSEEQGEEQPVKTVKTEPADQDQDQRHTGKWLLNKILTFTYMCMYTYQPT